MKVLVADSTPKRIKHIQFSVLSSKEAVAIAEFEANQRDLYNPGDRRTVDHGVLDRRLGTSDKSGKCDTCNLSLADCVGHYAYIKLVLPVFHIGYFKHALSILQCICKTCSRILLDSAQHRKYLALFRRPNLDSLTIAALAKQLSALCRKCTTCPHCGALNGVVKKIGTMRIGHEKWRGRNAKKDAGGRDGVEGKGNYQAWRDSFNEALHEDKQLEMHIDKAIEDLNPLKALTLFRKITSADCELLGLDPTAGRPEEFIWQYISVPPVCIRPSVAQEAATNEDDLTVKLTEIIFMNAVIKTGLAKGVTSQALMEQWDFLQLAVATYINSELPGIPSVMGQKPMRGLCQRLKGKQGRFRGNLSGKRVDFSGRTVISPDPNLMIDQVAVPERVAKILTYPERVTPHNIERLRQAVRNGTEVHPGANFINQGGDGTKKFLKFGDRDWLADKLRIGDVVERHLRDNDIVLFNRQPSLHRLSILSHRVKVRPWRTFRLNECVCTPYNADFDGDEMNLHVPQTEEAKTEAFQLMNIKRNLVTPRNGEPIIAATQDFITGCYLITRKDTFFNRQEFTQMCAYLQDAELEIELPPPTILKPERLWTGKQVFAVLMRPSKSSPVNVNLECKNKTSEKPSTEWLQEKGLAYPPFMSVNDGFLVVQNSEIISGVFDKATVGDGNKKSVFAVIQRDFGPDEAAKCMNRMAKLCARWLANKGFSIGISDVTPGEQLKAKKNGLVQEAYKQADEYIYLAGRGKLECQPGSNVEQTLESMISGDLSRVRDKVGEICMTELSRNNAPLIMATCGSKGSKINVSQMVACVGQQIIAGNRVPNGFQDRSLPHFPKGAIDPLAKGFVSNSFYSGLRPTEFLFHAISGREGLVDTAVKTAETGYMARRLMKALEDLSSRYDRSVRNATGGVVQFIYGDDGLDPANLEGDGKPVVFDRTWSHARALHLDARADGLLPYEIHDHVEKRTNDPYFTTSCSNEFLKDLRQFIDESIVQQAAKYRLEYGMPEALKPLKRGEKRNGKADAHQLAVVNNKTKVTRKQIDEFLQLCWTKYVKAKVEPGTAVGAIGAQSIGEPGTQMTLKTFHFAGVASMNVTLGVPRIKEIINAAKTISTPIITAKLVRNDSEQAARIVKGRVEKTFLGDIASVIASVYSQGQMYVSVHVDMRAIRALQLEITLDSIAASISSAPRLKIRASDITVKKITDEIHIVAHHANAEDRMPAYRRIMWLRRVLPGISVKGVPGLQRAVIQQTTSGKDLLVEGEGLREVMTTDGVIGWKTTSNHVMEVEKVLGIEAARKTIVDQIQYTMDSHGLGVDPRHLMLLGDVMCFKGEVLGITRFGVSKMKDSVLMLASFEKTTDHLFDASFYSRRDPIQGVSECIILGSPANNVGTAMPALVAAKPKLPAPYSPLFERPEPPRKGKAAKA
ncbi:putative DNA-directed RNA polymerase [Rhodotorula taiwanensis]|uniref:DNA-directed RNA polymerase subunit n=1 Tax=Rhodotorula taiwanensis TaxID=741276 RepID=A0A2S5BB34_9BASI|nr:putative DNA-directed RNA polymerase [Rhodotorula taiwanensis]